jgi:hypothetical protein
VTVIIQNVLAIDAFGGRHVALDEENHEMCMKKSPMSLTDGTTHVGIGSA